MIVELKDVSFSSEEQTVLDRISCRIDEGSCVLVMGPSGSGKTLLLKIMAGIIPASSGEVVVDGRSFNRLSEREILKTNLRTGFVFQDAALWQNLTLRQNLSLAVQYHFPNRPQGEIDARIAQLTRRTGFKRNLDLRPAHLSGGNRTIVSIMRALMLDPELYFMDEPSNGLDGETQGNILEILKDLKHRGRSLIIASHDSSIASMLADWILVMDEGRMLAFDTVGNLAATNDSRIKAILKDVLDLSTTYDSDILDILGGDDDNPFA
jgi:phospholipid/cholesterol/gamma-HCH transport system ATP-binding protein